MSAPVVSEPAPSRGPDAGGLLRVLGLAFGLAVIIGNTIGGGILRTPGEIAAQLPDPRLFLAMWIAGGLYALLGAISLAELGAMLPRSGGQYVFVRRALGPWPGFVTGWSDWISTCGSAALMAIVIGEYIGPLLAPLAGHESITASGVVVFFTLLQWRGIRTGDATQQVTSLIKTIALLALVAAILFLPHESLAAPPPADVPSGFGLLAAVVIGFQAVVYTYDGWTGVIYFGEEVSNPGRDIPRSMLGGVLLVLAIYLALNLAFLRVVPIGLMADDPFVAGTAATAVFGPAGDTVIRVLMIISLLAGVNACQLMASRVPLAMSRDGLLPARVTRVNPGGTPTSALLLSTGVALLMIVTNTFETVLALLAFFFVANYSLSFASVFVLRRREPDTPRPWRAWGFPWTTGIAFLGSVSFLVAALISDRANSVRALLLLAASVPVFFLVRRGSRV
jgi:APA family basic amino acid/polyamine antiporter